MPNIFEKPYLYSENEKNWQKSVSEFRKFILDNIDRPNFLEFLKGEEIDSPLFKRWRERSSDLLDKAQTRLGYHLDVDKLVAEAKQTAVEKIDSGEVATPKRFEELKEYVSFDLEEK